MASLTVQSAEDGRREVENQIEATWQLHEGRRDISRTIRHESPLARDARAEQSEGTNPDDPSAPPRVAIELARPTRAIRAAMSDSSAPTLLSKGVELAVVLARCKEASHYPG